MLSAGERAYRLSVLSAGERAYRLSVLSAGERVYRLSVLSAGERVYRLSVLSAGERVYRLSVLSAGEGVYRLSVLSAGERVYRLSVLSAGERAYRLSVLSVGERVYRLSVLSAGERVYRLSVLSAGERVYRLSVLSAGERAYRLSVLSAGRGRTDYRCCLRGRGCRHTHWELSNSRDRMLEITGRSVITAVVRTWDRTGEEPGGSCDRAGLSLGGLGWVLSVLGWTRGGWVGYSPGRVGPRVGGGGTGWVLTVLGPSAARLGFRAPPAPGFRPRIQTRCCGRGGGVFKTGRGLGALETGRYLRRGVGVPEGWRALVARRSPARPHDSAPGSAASACTGYSSTSAEEGRGHRQKGGVTHLHSWRDGWVSDALPSFKLIEVSDWLKSQHTSTA